MLADPLAQGFVAELDGRVAGSIFLSALISVGFRVREPLVLVGGALPKAEAGMASVRPATEADVAACNALCRRVHGVERDIVMGFDNASYYSIDKQHPHLNGVPGE